MSHPVLVDAIHNQFVPSLVYNNKQVDAEKLAQFKEPSWNNPVIRFLDHDFSDVISRKDGVWSTHQVCMRMAEALKAAKKQVPASLALVQLEHSPQSEQAMFAMHCYWEGEIQFGKLDGVKATSSAWYDGKEVVNVTFDPNITSYRSLVETALKVRCASTVFVRNPTQEKVARLLADDRVQLIRPKEVGRAAKASDQKYYLQASPLKWVPLTEVQQVRVNSSLGRREDPQRWFSESQLKMAEWVKSRLDDKELMAQLAAARGKLDLNAYFQYVKQRVE